MNARLLPALLPLLLAAPLQAQVIRGRLVDQTSGDPLDRGTLALLEGDSVLASSPTDSAGVFVLHAPGGGKFRLRAEREGYMTAVSPALGVPAKDTLHVEFELSTQTVVLDPIVVTGRRHPRSPLLADFDRRAKMKLTGTFITRADIERLHPLNTSDLLRRVPGVMLVPTGPGGPIATVRGGCVPTVWLDGAKAPPPWNRVDALIDPLDLEGIEVYKSASDAPPQFMGLRAGCAVILLWSRRGDDA